MERGGVGLALETAAMGLVVLLGTAANVLSLAGELRSGASRRGPVAPLVASLAAGGLALLGPASVGVAARWTEGWRLGDAACRSVFALLVAGGAASLLSTAAISAARLRALSRGPSRGGSRRELGAAGLTAGVIWALAALAAIPAALGFTTRGFTYGTQEVVVCTLVWPGRGGSLSWVSSMFVMLLLLPAMVMTASHARIIQVLRSNRARLHRPPGAPSTAHTPEGVSGAPRDTEDPEPGPLPGSPPGFAVAAITRAFAGNPTARGDRHHRRQRWRRSETGGPRRTPVPPRERRLRVTLCVLLLALCLSWGPLFAVMWVAEADVAAGPRGDDGGGGGGGPRGDERSEGLTLTSTAFVWALAACLVGAAANPWLYGNLRSRLCVAGALRRSCCCRCRRWREAEDPERDSHGSRIRMPPATVPAMATPPGGGGGGGAGGPQDAPRPWGPTAAPLSQTRPTRGEESGVTLELSV
uniref:Uncharacterized protein LOC116951389 n=1 Tax=Petromyzon marinus TaxID=7757 RepID=A0AAJ7XA91_PETMA|nr:uncharacterized protein LOC116951389 [Petromyzon marinus]